MTYGDNWDICFKVHPGSDSNSPLPLLFGSGRCLNLSEEILYEALANIVKLLNVDNTKINQKAVILT